MYNLTASLHTQAHTLLLQVWGILHDLLTCPSAASSPIARFPAFVHDVDKLSKPDRAAKEQHKQRSWGPTKGGGMTHNPV